MAGVVLLKPTGSGGLSCGAFVSPGSLLVAYPMLVMAQNISIGVPIACSALACLGRGFRYMVWSGSQGDHIHILGLF